MASKRHDDPTEKVADMLRTALEKLHRVWDEIGLGTGQQNARTEVVVLHLNNLLDEMIVEEEALRDRLLNNIRSHGTELLRLSKELGVPPYAPPEGLTTIQLEKELKRKVESWEKQRHERLSMLRKLQAEEQHLCDIMCTTPLYISSGTVPTEAQLNELQDHIRSLKTEKERRQEILKSTKQSIMKMLDELEQCPDTSFERGLLCEENDSFLLNNENMAALKQYSEELEKQQKDNFALASQLREHLETLWERLQISPEERASFRTKTAGFKPKVIQEMKDEIARCEVMKHDKIQQVIENMRRELIEWWDKCYIDDAERSKFKAFTENNFTETVLTEHEEEVERLKQYYKKNKDMLELVGRWKKLFDKFLEDEKRAADPNRYFNRGCNLLKEEKARKRVQKELPRVEEEVRTKIEEWEKSVGRPFLVNGVHFTKFIADSWEDYREEKERKKAERLQAKARLMEEELKYGSRPAHTPGKKRPLCTTPGQSVTNKRCRTPNGGTARVPLAKINVPSSNDTGFSQTTVSSAMPVGPVQEEASDEVSLDSVGQYQEFARGLNQTARPNCRSSVLPVSLKPAYF